MLLQKSVYEYAPTIMLLLIICVFSSLAVIRIIKRERLKKCVVEHVYLDDEKVEKILHYYSYECYLVEYYMCMRDTTTAALHRDFARSLRRALTYAGVQKEVIAEYGNRKDERL